jgi:SOS-response transcriptional repressor LexA
LFNLPILGLANCGQALELAQQSILGYLKISPKFLNHKKNPDGLFIVKAVGKSLNKANIKGKSIKSGDYAVIDSNLQPRNGDYVLSVIDGSSNIKKFYHDRTNKEIRLVSESTLKIPPIILHEDDLNILGYSINGVVIKVIRA